MPKGLLPELAALGSGGRNAQLTDTEAHGPRAYPDRHDRPIVDVPCPLTAVSHSSWTGQEGLLPPHERENMYDHRTSGILGAARRFSPSR